MTIKYYEIRLCRNCGLRYPLAENHPFGTRCPACLGDTQAVLKHKISLLTSSGEGAEVSTENRLSALLDNVRSAWNVGAIFRTADGLGISKLYLCGITPTPDNEAVRKTSLGSEETVSWDYAPNALEYAKNLKNDGYKLIALEQDERSKPIEQVDNLSPIVLVVGNEVTGVDPELLDFCDQIVHIPMRGQKRSFNVEVAFAITAYALLIA